MDARTVRQYATGRWTDILCTLGGISPEIFNHRHHPCPKCGGRDRFRAFNDFDQTGGVMCNKCFGKNEGNKSDGFSALGWLLGKPPNKEGFKDVLKMVADYLNVKPTARAKRSDPAGQLVFNPFSDQLVELWALNKRPITVAGVKAVGGRIASYQKKYTVLAVPVWGEFLTKADPVGWLLYNISGGPLYTRDGSEVKTKLTYGSRPGYILNVDGLSKFDKWPKTVWKLEGATDVMTMLSLNSKSPVFTNANGCGEQPKPWMVESIRGRTVNVLHDADEPGLKGAAKWCESFKHSAALVRWVKLPYETAESHGKDFRDYIFEGNGPQNLQDLLGMADEFEGKDPAEGEPSGYVAEEPDDPERLARVNLDTYKVETGGKLVFYREQFWKWKRNHYQVIDRSELKAKVRKTIKLEFNRIHQSDNSDFVRKVSNMLIGNVVAAMESECVVSGNKEMPCWIGEKSTIDKKSWMAVANGIMDVDEAITGGNKPLINHTPDWFSANSLPARFDEDAECPKWEAFIEYAMDGDEDRIALLQEWAGYTLLPDTGFAKFLILEGEGANGKSVFLAGIEAMLGGANCSHLGLEDFSQQFSRSSTIGKLVNISADVGDMDRSAEGILKSMTSGDRIYFDRKGISGLDATPTARLMLATNTRPRFTDRSGGLWRRMLIVPFLRIVPQEKRVRNMDKPTWWQDQNEVTGMLNWALIGLARLRRQNRFTEPAVCEAALASYRRECNPARIFIEENLETRDPLDSKKVATNETYAAYKKWCSESGHRPYASNQFNNEIHRYFLSVHGIEVQKKRFRDGNSRPTFFLDLFFKNDEFLEDKKSFFED